MARKFSKKQHSNLSMGESLIQVVRHKDDDVIDEDRYFLLSLLPSFRRFNDEQKFLARMEILRVMKKIKMAQTICNYRPRSSSSGLKSGTSATTCSDMTTESVRHCPMKLDSSSPETSPAAYRRTFSNSLLAARNTQESPALRFVCPKGESRENLLACESVPGMQDEDFVYNG